MAEIMAKSKASRRDRAKEKEADDDQLVELDSTFKTLADVRPGCSPCPYTSLMRSPPLVRQGGLLRNSLRTSTGHMKPGRPARGERGRGRHRAEEDEDDFDKLAQELAADARASRVSDRLKTADELAAEKAAQLGELERKRLKRMRARGSDDEGSDDDDEDERKGGYAARRQKRQKQKRGDKAPRPETVRTSLTDTPRAQPHSRCAQGDDLGDNLALDDGTGDEEASGGSSDEEDEAEDEDELRQSFKEKARSLRSKGNLERGMRRLRRLGILNDGGTLSSSGEEEDEDEGDEEGAHEEGEEGEEEAAEEFPAALPVEAPKASRVRARGAAVESELPYVFEAPASHAQFAAWVTGRSAADLSHVITRICACHAIALAPENRRKLQVFFGVLLVHFESLAQQAPLPQGHLDVMVPHLLALCREVPYYAATAARARLTLMQASVAEAQSRGAPGWPPPRTLLLLRLFTLMFPASDFRHPVLTAVALMLGQYLSHCEVRCTRDACLGVLVAALAVQLAAASGRYVPEAISFAAALVHASAEGGEGALAGLPAHLAHQMGGPWLHLPPLKAVKTAAPLLSLSRVLQTPADDPFFDSWELRTGALHAALQVLAAAAERATSLSAATALLTPARAAAERLQQAEGLPRATLALAAAVISAHDRAASAAHPPLQLHARKAEAIKAYNPSFEEEGFVKGRDYDVDRTRSEARRLKKQVAREAKGAARELRKDNRFLAEERARQQAAASSEREAKYKSALSFLEAQEADFKSGGQGGAAKRRKQK